MTKGKFRLLSVLSKLGKDEDGHILLYFTIMLPVIVGMIGLTLDGGRLFHLNTDLQELADASALAGAAELDGADGARVRATNAAKTLLSNDPHWSNVAQSGLQIIDPPTYYKSLNPDTPATGDADAVYIKVTTVNRQVSPTFIPVTALMLGLGAPSNGQTSVSAVAGSTYVACNVQPLMLCNPNELPGGGGTDFSASQGQMFKFTPKGAGQTTFAPGDFGLLDPAGQSHSGANEIRNLLSQTTPNLCYINNLSPRPGQATNKVQEGINVRFDMAPNGAGNQAGLDLTPAPNVIKGHIPKNANNACGPFDDHPELRFPRDTTMTTTAGVAIGNGVMDATAMNTYWAGHHGAGTTWPAGVTTRFDAYKRELGLNGSAPSWIGEPNAPTCNGVPAGNYKRRVISVAVINCLAQNVQGNTNTNLRSNKYAEFFITEPATDPPDGAIYTEFIQMITPESPDGKLHHIVQLYR